MQRQWGCSGGVQWGRGGASDLRLSSSTAEAEGVAESMVEGMAEAEGMAEVWPSSSAAWLRARAQPCASW